MTWPSLRHGAAAVVREPNAARKAELSRALAAAWFAGDLSLDADGSERNPPSIDLPDDPGRPDAPALLEPRDMPKRGGGSPAGRVATLHAIAHIELNAIDLHWDICARFPDVAFPRGFYDDWALAADQEAKHFQLLSSRLKSHGSYYGALPAHAGLWNAAKATAGDLMARLAVVPMVLEARGLDVTPGMIELFGKAGDDETVAALEIIYSEEVGHVAYGAKWFHFLCGRRELDPKETFHDLVKRYFGGRLRPPFNDEKRAEAGLPLDFYWPLAD
ncbi:MAG: ferritin-like domain-containing protein [Pseudomonadota bacterium]